MAVLSKQGSKEASRSISPRLVRCQDQTTEGKSAMKAGKIRREGGEETNVSSDLARTVMYSKAAMWMANWIRIESKT